MAVISYRRHRFPPAIIQHAVWLYLRFTLSYRDVEELLAERGLDISYETVRCWVLKFVPVIRATATPVPSAAEQPLAPRRAAAPDVILECRPPTHCLHPLASPASSPPLPPSPAPSILLPP